MEKIIKSSVFIFIFMVMPCIPSTTGAQLPGFGSSQPEIKSSQKIMSSNNGRYVFGQISDTDKDRFMLDTITGRLWWVTESGKIGMYLKPVPYKTGEDTYSLIPEEIEASIQGPENN